MSRFGSVNFSASLYSDCQLADILYRYNHMCMIVINICLYVNFNKFFLSTYFDCQLTDNILYHSDYSHNIVCHHAYMFYIYAY
jgi:hypothetical protein